MDIKEILAHTDHTLLSVTATREQIAAVVDDGIRYSVASVCIPPCYVAFAAERAAGRVRICTVIGFPNGYQTSETKCFEAADAVSSGADEIDMVINLGMVKDGRFDELLDEIRSVKAACRGKLLKVIVETCCLTTEEKIRLCELVSVSGADYIKTSSGFSTGGATREDIALFAAHITGGLKIKAAGGIRTLGDAEDFLALGADRLGASAIVKAAKTL